MALFTPGPDPSVRRPSRTKLWIGLVALTLIASACGVAEEQLAGDNFDDGDTGSEVDSDSAQTCTPEELGADEDTELVTGHLVVDGELGELCFGEPNDAVIEAFEELAVITPPDQMTDLGLFAGFVWEGADDEVTLAFVSPVDDAHSQFLLAIEVEEFVNDRDEASLTNAHEFAHVFTQTQTELDTEIDPADCDTYWNGSGCFREDSLMFAWITEFWNSTQLDALVGEASVDGGAEQCALDDSFFGQYAASDPEEDFAEAFSAYVFGLEPATNGQAQKVAWIQDQPGLAEFRERADAAGLTPLTNNFEVCG